MRQQNSAQKTEAKDELAGNRARERRLLDQIRAALDDADPAWIRELTERLRRFVLSSEGGSSRPK
jgi:hypothetical protein